MNPPDSKPKAIGRIKKIVYFHPFKAIFISVHLWHTEFFHLTGVGTFALLTDALC